MEKNTENNAVKPVKKPWKGFPTRLKRFCRFLVGLVFVLSGLLKLLDPVGTGLIMSAYYDFLHIGFMDFSAKIAGLFFALVETFAGAALVSGVWRKATAYVVSVFLGFFTILTVALVIFNPEMDCGCFGEAVHLTHKQSLVKNLVLCALGLVAFLPYNYFGRPKKRKYVAFSLVSMAIACFTAYSLIYIPFMDFTAYQPGVQLMSAKDYGQESYQATFIYEKDGEQEVFTLDDLPDSTWTFISTKTVKLSSAGELPVLSISDADGGYHDDLLNIGRAIVISVYDVEAMTPKRWRNVQDCMNAAEEAGFRSLLLVSGADGNVPELPVYFSDYKTLVSLNRSNGGASYFYDGHIIRKWGYANLPDGEELHEEMAKDATETVLSSSTRGSLVFQGFLLYIFAVMLLL